VSTSDPVLYPAEAGSTEALRQEAARTRLDVARTVELLAERLQRRPTVGPTTVAPVAVAVGCGLGAWAALLIHRRLRPLASIGGLGAAVAGFAVTRRAMAPRPTASVVVTADRDDVVDLLLAQHRDIMSSFATVLDASGHDRTETFAALVELLQRHERAEQAVVHPVLRAVTGEAGEVAEARVEEEKAADRALASLISKTAADPTFEAALAAFRQTVQDHAGQEESREFPLLRELVPAEQLRRMAGDVRRTP
jgi:hemerythrin superfamily protein